jgi:hypothetical protein
MDCGKVAQPIFLAGCRPFETENAATCLLDGVCGWNVKNEAVLCQCKWISPRSTSAFSPDVFEELRSRKCEATCNSVKADKYLSSHWPRHQLNIDQVSDTASRWLLAHASRASSSLQHFVSCLSGVHLQVEPIDKHPAEDGSQSIPAG